MMEKKKLDAHNLMRLLSLLLAIVCGILVLASFLSKDSGQGFDTRNFREVSSEISFKDSDGVTKTITLPYHIELSAGEEAMFYFQAPSGTRAGDYLFIWVDDFDMVVYAGNQCIGNYRGTGQYPLGGDLPSEWYPMQFARSYDYTNFYVRVSAGSTGYRGWLRPAYVGDKSAIIFELMRTDVPTVITYLILLIVGVIICLQYFAVFFRKVNDTSRYFALGIGMLFLSFHFFLDSNIRQVFISNISAAQTLHTLCLATAAVAFAIYLLYMGKRLKKKTILIPLITFIASFAFDGTLYYLQISKVPHILLMIGTIAISVGVSLDIRDAVREKHENESKALEYNIERTAFLGRVSHAIRTPVNTIQGMNSVLLRETKDPATRKHSQNVRSAIESLLAIIDDILDISRIESGKMEIAKASYDFMSLVNDLKNIINLSAGEKGLSFEVENNPDIPSRLIGDEIRIRQATLNILSNAVKYTKKGSVSLSFDFERRQNEEKSLTLLIRVKDTGEGIRPEDMEHLFDSYERIDEKTNAEVEGTGLGLSITKDIVNMMGGEISAESTFGEGSTFTITLPQGIDDETGAGSFLERQMETRLDQETVRWFKAPLARVLVVDDVKMNLDVMCALFEPAHMTVDIAGGGDECLKLLTEHKYDIIFLDHMMPHPDGIATFKRMANLPGNQNQGTPVIMLTANAVIGAKEEYLKIGFTDYLSKPVSEQTLVKMCRKYLPANLIEDISEAEALAMEEEKQKEADKNSELLETLSTFLDTEKGLSYSMGKVDFYLNSLNAFSTNGQIDLMKDSFEKKDMPEYKIHVHALKGVARIIGATELSEKAKALEDASGNGDIAFVTEHHDEIIRDFNEISEALQEILSQNSDSPDAGEFSKEDFKETLQLMINCADEIDIDGMDKAAEMLKSFAVPADLKETYDKLLHEEAEIHFDEVKLLSNKLISMVG